MKTILIDMYGVILKESKGYFIPYTFQHFNEDQYDRLTRQFKEEQLFTQASSGLISSDEFLKKLGFPNPEWNMKDYIDNYLTLDEQFTDFAKNLGDNYEMVLLSNDVSDWSKYITSSHDLDKYFKDKIVSADVKMRKPDSAIFTYALERVKKNPEDCVFIDNSVDNLNAATALGIKSILFNRDNVSYDGAVVNNFIELSDLLN